MRPHPLDDPDHQPPATSIQELVLFLRHIPTGEALAAALLAHVRGELFEARAEVAGELVGIRPPSVLEL